MTDQLLDRYARAYEQLQPGELDKLAELLAEDVYFTDPFNQLHGREAVVRVFEHMFETVDDARFEVLDCATGRNGSGYIRWCMTGSTKGRGNRLSLDGMSEIEFNAEGKVKAHIDHWDSLSQLFAKLPLVGGIARWVMRRLAVK